MSDNQQNMEVVEFPDEEPATPFPEGLDGSETPIPDSAYDSPPINFEDQGFDLPAENFSDSTDIEAGLDSEAGLDFSDLLGHDLDDSPGTDDQNLDGSPADADDLLNDFTADNLESFDVSSTGTDDSDVPSQADSIAGEDTDTDLSGMEFPDFDLTNAVDMGGEINEAVETPADQDPAAAGDFDLDSLDFDTAFSAEPGDSGEDSLPDLDTDFGIEDSTPPLSAPPPPRETDDFGIEGLGTVPDGGEFGDISVIDETSKEDVDSFSTGDDLPAPDETEKISDSATDELGDFSLAGYDDLAEPAKAGSKTARSAPGAPEEVEEIRLNESEFHQLQSTLSAYPLNLRIACEELIAEQAVAPDLMSSLIKLLVRGAPAKETAALAGKILGKNIPISKGYAKKTGAELEAEQASFGYIFKHSILPVLRLAAMVALIAGSLVYLVWSFAVIPIMAENRYKEGYTLLKSGQYIQANDQFKKGFELKRAKKWFYRYAEAFRDERQYIYAEQKYDELLRVYPRDKKGALDYAAMETNIIKNFEKADRIIRTNILDYAVNDREGLLALAENSLAWGEIEKDRYEDARASYARLLEKYGRKDFYLEGMLKYFIRTDKLNEVMKLQSHFMSDPKKRKITVPALAELGGYLIDKQFADTEGVPDEFTDKIDGIRDVLVRAIRTDGSYPESYYHLARYYHRYGSVSEERQSLRDAIRTFAVSPEESARRVSYRIDAIRRHAEILINAKEFFPAEEELITGVQLYENALSRQVFKNPVPELGRLYANLGDLEFFVKEGNMDAALAFYEKSEQNGWSPPEIRYRMGVAHYQNEDWEDALQRFFALTSDMPNNKRLLYALGNTTYLRGNYFAAQGYYNRLMDLLDAERVNFPVLVPGNKPDGQDLTERIMVANNNLGVTLENLTRISGNTSYRSRALYLLAESIRAWDVLTRDPESMTRMRPIRDLYGPGINLPYLNVQNILHPSPAYDQQIFLRIDRDSLEPSPWENIIPREYHLSDQLLPMQVE